MDYNVSSSELSQIPVEGLTYEQAFSELESIVAALEGDKSPLEESLALFERGRRLVRYCATQLERAQLKIQQLSGDTLVDFNEQE